MERSLVEAAALDIRAYKRGHASLWAGQFEGINHFSNRNVMGRMSYL